MRGPAKPHCAARRRACATVGAWAGGAGWLALAGAAAAAPAARGERVAWPVVTLLDGARFGADQAEGRACVVVFWSTTCPFCRRHNRHVQRLQAMQVPGLVVLGVAREADAAAVRRHAAAEGYTFPITLEAEPMAAALTRRRLVPQTVTIGRDGLLQWVIPGEMSEEDVLALARLPSAP